MSFPLLPTLHWMSPLKSSLLAMSTLFHVTASFSSSLYGLASTDARCLLATHTRGCQSQHALSYYRVHFSEKKGLPTSYKSFKQNGVKVIRALLLSVVDGDEVSVLVNAQSLKSRRKIKALNAWETGCS